MQVEMDSIKKTHIESSGVTYIQGGDYANGYTTQYKFDGTMDTHKVCLVTKGCEHKEGIDYEETSILVVKMNII
jgi:hypothetical protein